MFVICYLRRQNWWKIRWQIHKYEESFVLEDWILFLLIIAGILFFYNKSAMGWRHWYWFWLTQAEPTFTQRECIWILYWKHACHETNMPTFLLWQQMISSSWVKWENWGFQGGLHHDLGEGVAFRMGLHVQFPSSEHHPLPQFSIWEMGGSQWNYCITKPTSTHFLLVKYCAEYMSSSNTNSPIKWYH